MFCRKCGFKIPDNELACPKCGEKIIFVNNGIERIDTHATSQNRKNKIIVFSSFTVVILFIIICLIIHNVTICHTEGCGSKRINGSKYCFEHTCLYPDCSLESKYFDYCYSHRCQYTNCTNRVGGEDYKYCIEHNCEYKGCKNQRTPESCYCKSHQTSMRSNIRLVELSFSLNSAGGIELNFEAINCLHSKIKYVEFPMHIYNAVGDEIKTDFNEETINVKISGNADYAETVKIDREIVGYCKKANKIQIDNITVIYTDGTKMSGHYGYYAYKDT